MIMYKVYNLGLKLPLNAPVKGNVSHSGSKQAGFIARIPVSFKVQLQILINGSKFFARHRD